METYSKEELKELFPKVEIEEEEGPRYTNINQREQILKLHNKGYNQREIAELLHISPSTVNLWINRLGNLDPQKRTGRLRKTTTIEDDAIYSLSTDDPFLPATDINRTLQLNLHPQTVRNRLMERGLKNFKVPLKPFLTETVKQSRLEFAFRYEPWNEEFWEQICFADEKTFQSYGNANPRVWRPKITRWDEVKNPITRFHESRMSHQKTSGRFRVLVWGCIGRINKIHRITQHTLNAFYYEKTILETYFKEGGFYLLQDNSSIHRAISVKKWLQDHNISTLSWPSYSPDLNPIENLWGKMEYMMRNRNPGTVDDLWKIVEDTFKAIVADKKYITKLTTSMYKRLQVVRDTEGEMTKW